jgi:hypothetical protein
MVSNFRKYYDIGYHLYPKFSFYNPEKNTARFKEFAAVHANSVVLQKKHDLVKTPYYNTELMGLLRKHLPSWENFHTWHYTFAQAQWDSIRSDWDTSSVTFVELERPLLQRDRLAQIFQACPPGSYGYYAARGLAPFKLAVGSFASAQIDEFFASNVEVLVQPYSALVNDIMSMAETAYWDSQEEFTNWLAGKFLRKSGRERGVGWPALAHQFAFGTPQPGGEPLSESELQKVREILAGELPKMNKIAFEDFLKDDAAVLTLYQEIQADRKRREEERS